MRETPARMPRASVTTELVTVLFTDIVSSTEIASEVGDRRWRALVAAHHGLVRQSLKRHRGRELDTAGDGFFASFPRPAGAIRCAVEVAEGVREFGLEIRAGVHLGEAEIMGGKVGGMVVNTGARIMAIGTAGEVLVSSTVRDAVAGKGIGFADHGIHQLKGIDGEVHVHVVTTLDDRTLEAPLDPSEALRRRQLPPPVPRSRPRWVIAAAIAGAVVIGAAGFALSWGSEPETEPRASATAGTRPMTAMDDDLVAVVPEAFAASCVPTEAVPVAATASVTCVGGPDGGISVRYDAYETVDDLEHAFTISTAGVAFEGVSCRDDPTATTSYSVNGVARGSVACWIDEELLSFRPTIAWIDEALMVLATAVFETVTTFRGNVPDLSLYRWWSEEGGPTESGIVSPKDDPLELPQGTFAMTISQDEAGPVNEGFADEHWVGSYRITLERDTFIEESVGTYEVESGLLWGKGDRMILVRDYTFPPAGGVTEPCQRLESLRWDLDGDTLHLSDPSPERECQVFRDLASYKPWERVG